MRGMASDKGTTLAGMRLRLFGVGEGKSRGNYKLSPFVLLCSSASVILNLRVDGRGKREKKKKLHINMSGGIIDDVRF